MSIVAVDVSNEADGLHEDLKTLRSITNLVYEYDELDDSGQYVRKIAIVKMIGYSCPKNDYKKGIKHIVNALNHIHSADSKNIIGFLGPIINKIEMVDNRVVVVTYPALTTLGETILHEDIDLGVLEEGGIPIHIEEVNDIPED